MGLKPASPVGHAPHVRQQRFGGLHTLDLTKCTGLTDVADLAHCPSLHTLHLTDCTRLTDQC